jgi:hypothetical protein
MGSISFLNDEKGGSSLYIALAIGAGLLLLTPILLNISNVHIERRVSQTASDAASLAAVLEYAMRFSGPGRHVTSVDCSEPLPSVKQRAGQAYQSEKYQPNLRRDVGESVARQYASKYSGTGQNSQAWLSGFDFPIFRQGLSLFGGGAPIYFPAVALQVETQKSFPPLYGQLFQNRQVDVPAKAMAEAYPTKLEYKSIKKDECIYCTPDGCVDVGDKWEIWVEAEWKTRLIQ